MRVNPSGGTINQRSTKAGLPTRIRILRRDREAEGYLGRTVKHLDDMTTHRATELTGSAGRKSELDAAIASEAFGTGDIRFSHTDKIARMPVIWTSH